MKCPKCSEKMGEGVMSIESGGLCHIIWTDEKVEKYSYDKVSSSTLKEIVEPSLKLKYPKGFSHYGFRCRKCKLITFDYSKHYKK